MTNKSEKLKVLGILLLTFIKIGIVTFGGGYAMIPLIEKEIVDKRKWVDDKEMIDIIALSEATPGPIGICCATFIGYQVVGILGAIVATIGAILPSFIIIYLISIFFDFFQKIMFFKYLFFGLRACVLALIVKAVFTMYKSAPKNILAYIIMVLSFILVVFFSCNVIYIIIGAAVIGICFSIIQTKRGKKL